jgi:hypothetical protein
MPHSTRQREWSPRRIQRRVFFLAALFVVTAAQGNMRPDDSPPRRTVHATELGRAVPEALVFTGAVLIGVDVNGRILAALDERGDGRGDRFYLFRTLGPYQGPWSRLLQHATLIETDGGLAIFTDDHLFGVTLSLETGAARLPAGFYREAHSYGGGIELSVATPEDGYPGPSLNDLSFTETDTWPEAFRPPETPPAAAAD